MAVPYGEATATAKLIGVCEVICTDILSIVVYEVHVVLCCYSSYYSSVDTHADRLEPYLYEIPFYDGSLIYIILIFCTI